MSLSSVFIQTFVWTLNTAAQLCICQAASSLNIAAVSVSVFEYLHLIGCYCFRALAPERKRRENVQIFKELHYHQGKVIRNYSSLSHWINSGVSHSVWWNSENNLCPFVCHQDFLQSYSANEFRMFCLLAKYRSGEEIHEVALFLFLFLLLALWWQWDVESSAVSRGTSMIYRGVSTAVDYSDSSMSQARTSLGTISTFIHDAQAYLKGQLQCLPVQEAFLWER